MKVRMVVIAATLAMLWGTGAAVVASDGKDSAGQAPSTVAAAEIPEAILPELKFQFDPVVDGTQITHDFAIKNAGSGPLAIANVKTGWGCSVASYPRQIPAGGEGTITIKVNTSGYGGKNMKKHVEVFTNDTSNARITLTISGSVLNFAKMEPRYARLVGPAGTDIKKVITITSEKAYPFKILRAKARNGKDIAFDVKAFSKADGEGYILTIENRKTVAGRYADTVILTTDSQIKPAITIPVYGQIISAAPQPAPATTNKSAGDGWLNTDRDPDRTWFSPANGM